MGRISDIIPSLYYENPNDLIKFVDALDVEVNLLEKQVAGITDLINVDKCPDDKLPYLAALTNCPLMGNNPVLWRRQIKNWPYMLKIKGTALSLDIFLNSIDVDEHKIYTFFRDAQGNLTEEKPEGLPFKDENGIWRNIRTHYFDLDIIWNDGHFLTWTDWHEDFLRSINIWLERAKPFHSELRNLKLFLLRNSEQNLHVGTITSQGHEHDIAIVQGTQSATDSKIVTAAGTSQGYHHDIKIIQGTEGKTGFNIATGIGTSQGYQHNIKIIQATQNMSELKITTGIKLSRCLHHEINIAQSTKAATKHILLSQPGRMNIQMKMDI